MAVNCRLHAHVFFFFWNHNFCLHLFLAFKATEYNSMNPSLEAIFLSIFYFLHRSLSLVCIVLIWMQNQHGTIKHGAIFTFDLTSARKHAQKEQSVSQFRTPSFSFNARHTKMEYFCAGRCCQNIDVQISIKSKGQSTIVIEGNTFIDVKYSWDGQIMDEQVSFWDIILPKTRCFYEMWANEQ